MAGRRRHVGIGAIKKEALAKQKFAEKSTAIADLKFAHVTSQVEVFKKHLEKFAADHKNDIRSKPEFRAQFQQMCARIGVDPLASSKGFWAQMLGVGDFYYELGVKIIEICLAAKERTGGLMGFDELKQRLMATRGKSKQEVSDDDIARAIKKLKLLGNGFAIIPVGKHRLVQSVPGELSLDHSIVLQKAEKTSHVSVATMVSDYGWTEVRAKKVLDHMIAEGMAWLDTQNGEEPLYWFPGLFTLPSNRKT
ncbi:vacuolar-sorting protein SNF8-like [Dysidea avara]|uniref:vacuolar-sorting protein SNF8-like n=1 Tax=Dysidea avara TaxID=196820 RepID=UPI00332D3F0F